MSYKVALVNMPFGFHIYPSIQLGVLSTLLKANHWQAKSHYLNLHFAFQIGTDVYNTLCEKRFLIGEWLFSDILFGDSEGNQQYTERFSAHIDDVCQSIGCTRENLLDLKKRIVPEFLHWAAESRPWGDYDAVGFTSTFNQNLASVTLAKLIKDKHPNVKILFGGANFESEMGLEYFRAFPWIDFALPGEAEHCLPPLITALEKNEPIPKGVIHRREDKVVFEENFQMFHDFDKYPLPDYDDFFEEIRTIDPQSRFLENPIILYETARGCWWGEKHHCTFCGLNASTMKFRARSPERVLEDLAELSSKYDSYRFRLVDNILENQFVDAVFGELADRHYDMEFFIEIKSNLSKGQIERIARGGVNVIQPGIESFSPNQLVEMDKGVRPIQNMVCLKWALYYGIEVTWSILTGFPEETDEDFMTQMEIIRPLLHLQPPISVGNIWLERFSPYFTRPDKYGIKITGPGVAYPYVYDENTLDLMKIAYDFEFVVPERKVSPQLETQLSEFVSYWKDRHASEYTPYLFFSKSRDFVTVFDGRDDKGPQRFRFDGVSAHILNHCNEKPRSLDNVSKLIETESGTPPSETELLSAAQELVEARILFEERGKYFNLALPTNSRY
ncbi:MAG: RiPP maturation radical SAM protein 1 [Candidatus Nitrohelix vancouverensis]|uniref:RiPP maturation radical SAM protein 1 n=1 Tax=Candidatus Nitrohelix vancouverensis TaxID=2705534 RepID=A0A7T0G2L8_9BACT|nr:MAG: RiPP maturation radical SAM protein 1 [Candidatus Nitrohelix vancouverensis]